MISPSDIPAPPRPAPACPICDDLQWVSLDVPIGHPDFGKLFPCTCQQAERDRSRAEALRASRDIAHLAHMTFATFQSEGHALNVEQRGSLRNAYEGSQRYADEPRGWLLIQGGYGVGKTHLAAAIANACLSQSLPVTFLNTPDLLDHLRGAFSPNAEETYDRRFDDLRESPLLILDDLGTQNATAWAEEKLFQLLNHRYVAKLPTVITTNLPLDDLDPRLSSRLADMDLVRKLPIDAPDFRRSALEQGQSSLSSLAHYHDKTFESFDVREGELSAEERRNLKEALSIARAFAEQPKDWLVFFGTYGSGKTHLAAAIANRRVEQGYPALFVVVPDLLDHLRAAFSPQSNVSYDQRFEEVRTSPLLILDDLGTESATPWAREKLYQIINYRYTARLPTVITTALSPDEFDPRIRSRILDETRCRIIPILAPSYRGGRAAEKAARAVSRTSLSRKRN
ncbi:MAG TPA: ATP-binding protein [Anaerolineae bacterium]|nr:ATP-binding protein [Anaerolineae bacterium]